MEGRASQHIFHAVFGVADMEGVALADADTDLDGQRAPRHHLCLMAFALQKEKKVKFSVEMSELSVK